MTRKSFLRDRTRSRSELVPFLPCYWQGSVNPLEKVLRSLPSSQPRKKKQIQDRTSSPNLYLHLSIDGSKGYKEDAGTRGSVSLSRSAGFTCQFQRGKVVTSVSVSAERGLGGESRNLSKRGPKLALHPPQPNLELYRQPDTKISPDKAVRQPRVLISASA